VDERGDVDAVDDQAAVVLEPRRVDLHARHVDTAHDDTGQVRLDEPCAA